MLRRLVRQCSNAGVLLLALCLGGAMSPAPSNIDADGANQSRSALIYLAQLGAPVQSACLTTCNKRCTVDYNSCSLNGKAPKALISSTCSPHLSTCNLNCGNSCVK
jgi:hypothetical protein